MSNQIAAKARDDNRHVRREASLYIHPIAVALQGQIPQTFATEKWGSTQTTKQSMNPSNARMKGMPWNTPPALPVTNELGLFSPMVKQNFVVAKKLADSAPCKKGQGLLYYKKHQNVEQPKTQPREEESNYCH